MLSMAERIRLTFDVPDRVRRAINICASRLTISVGEVLEGLVDGTIPPLREELAFADRAIEEGRPASKSKPGRKPKARD